MTSTVQALAGHITVVIVAHRLSTVKHCDQVAFLEQGRVAARGTFDQVIAQSPAFAHMVRLGELTSH